jgi:hypothetical protein
MKGLFKKCSKNFNFNKTKLICKAEFMFLQSKYFANNTQNNLNNEENRDDKFWEEYKNKMKNRKLLGPIGSQVIQVNHNIHIWKYSKRHSILCNELYEELKNIPNNTKLENVPFILLDIREESEHELFTFPLRNKQGAELPVLNRSINDLNYQNYTGIPLNKYIILIDSIGLRSRRYAHLLVSEGFLALYVEGGVDMIEPLIKRNGL